MSKARMQMLVCMDLRPGSLPALAEAVRLAAQVRAELHLCHIAKGLGMAVASKIGLDDPSSPAELQELEQRLHDQLTAVAARPPATVHVRRGRPVEEILELINELLPDVVIVLRAEKDRWKRVQLGATARQLAAKSPVAVLIVPAKAR